MQMQHYLNLSHGTCITSVLSVTGVNRLPNILGLPTSFDMVRMGNLKTYPR